MKNPRTIRKAMLVAALAVVTATAWATNESLSSSPDVTAQAAATTALDDSVPTVDVRAHEIVVPSEAPAPVIANEPARAPAMPTEKVAEPTATQPPITVEERRLTEDERIQAEVMDKLASNPRLSGKIAVEARNSEVWLSGWTGTAGQAWNAGRDAGSVRGVRYVHNEIRPRVGHSL